MPLIETSLAYMAGFFDGEGCVNFTQSGQYKTWVIRVMVRNTNREVIDAIRHTFGGAISVTRHSNKPAWKPSFCWTLTGGKAVDFLRLIEPYVMVKKDQITLAIVWDDNRNRAPGPSTGADYKSSMELLARQMQWLNRKGPRSESDAEPMQEVLDSIPEHVKAEMRHAFVG